MKLTVLFLGAVLQMNVVAYGQPITLSVKDAPLDSVFKKIEQQTDYKFLYASQLLAAIPTVTISVKHASVRSVLDSILKGRKLDCTFNGNTIVIRPYKPLRFKFQAPLSVPNILEERSLLANDSIAANGVSIVIKSTPYWTIIDMRNGEFFLTNVDDSIMLVSPRAGDKGTRPMQNKKVASIQRIVIMRGYHEMQVWVYETPHHPLVVFRRKVVGVKVILQIDSTKRNTIWVPLRKSPGVSLIPRQGVKKRV